MRPVVRRPCEPVAEILGCKDGVVIAIRNGTKPSWEKRKQTS
jgi:hypothetical protein